MYTWKRTELNIHNSHRQLTRNQSQFTMRSHRLLHFHMTLRKGIDGNPESRLDIKPLLEGAIKHSLIAIIGRTKISKWCDLNQTYIYSWVTALTSHHLNQTVHNGSEDMFCSELQMLKFCYFVGGHIVGSAKLGKPKTAKYLTSACFLEFRDFPSLLTWCQYQHQQRV